MVNIPSAPEIITVNSPNLETQVAQLLPSQRGFGSELQASNVIIPVIDLTTSAEGTNVPEYAQRAWDFSTTHNKIENATTDLVANPGFYQVDANASYVAGGADGEAQLIIDDGASTKVIWQANITNSGAGIHGVSLDRWEGCVWLRSGDTLKGVSNQTNVKLNVSLRQVVDAQGVLVNPTGFPV